MNINSVVQRVTVTRHNSLVIDNAELRDMLRQRGFSVPANARIYFSVPGGGDWSNTDIDIDKDNPISIEWVVEQVQESIDGQEGR